MKKVWVSILFSTLSLLSSAQPPKNVVIDGNAEVRKVPPFNAIEISGAIDAFLSQGNEDALIISANPDEAKQQIKTEVKGTTLQIYFSGNGWRNWYNSKTKAYITFKEINKIEASGACNVATTDAVKCGDIKIYCSGASDFKGHINASGSLYADASGASNMKIKGECELAKIEASGASTIKAYELQVNTCKAEASGAANIKINVSKELKASASGASCIYYKGAPQAKETETSGGASIKKVE